MNKTIIQDKNLGEIIKSLFSVSSRLLIDFVNVVFNEEFSHESTKAMLDKNSVSQECFNSDVLNEDICIKISTEEQEYRYHIKIQTQNDVETIKAMFDTGFHIARENRGNERVYFPKQVVILVEENENVNSELKALLVSPIGVETEYTVPLMNLRKFNIEELLQKRIYLLLPLKLFVFKMELEKAKDTVMLLIKKLDNLRVTKELTEKEFKKMLLVINDIIKYFNRKYTNSSNLQS